MNEISYRETFQGAIELSVIVDGQYVHRQYMGYSKEEAMELFKKYIGGLSHE